jgi:hypothetical protein
LVSTFSQFDWAVGVWYPKASALAGDATEAIGPPKWGGMGSDGFQGVGPAADLAIASSGEGYVLDAGTYHRVDAQAVIKDISQSSFAGAHSDIAHPEVAWLIVSAAAAPASD